MISAAERLALLRLARASVWAQVHGQPPAEPSVVAGELSRRAGAFVTLHKQGHLRGCIGYVEPDRPLAQVVAQCAVAACSADPRFPAVAPAELSDIEIELSVLGPLEPIVGLDQMEVGRHGLAVELGLRRGLLLPQVAVERGWDCRTFVEQTCQKAGLSPDAWAHGSTTLWKFEAEVFGEAGLPTVPTKMP
ncbi:MAG: AmmeMemoRadiSam system protein A [Luteitalea sp.]|nr:AmmeMemoRadiSam system protein A [Luteitalea sp.]